MSSPAATKAQEMRQRMLERAAKLREKGQQMRSPGGGSGLSPASSPKTGAPEVTTPPPAKEHTFDTKKKEEAPPTPKVLFKQPEPLSSRHGIRMSARTSSNPKGDVATSGKVRKSKHYDELKHSKDTTKKRSTKVIDYFHRPRSKKGLLHNPLSLERKRPHTSETSEEPSVKISKRSDIPSWQAYMIPQDPKVDVIATPLKEEYGPKRNASHVKNPLAGKKIQMNSPRVAAPGFDDKPVTKADTAAMAYFGGPAKKSFLKSTGPPERVRQRHEQRCFANQGPVVESYSPARRSSLHHNPLIDAVNHQAALQAYDQSRTNVRRIQATPEGSQKLLMMTAPPSIMTTHDSSTTDEIIKPTKKYTDAEHNPARKASHIDNPLYSSAQKKHTFKASDTIDDVLADAPDQDTKIFILKQHLHDAEHERDVALSALEQERKAHFKRIQREQGDDDLHSKRREQYSLLQAEHAEPHALCDTLRDQLKAQETELDEITTKLHDTQHELYHLKQRFHLDDEKHESYKEHYSQRQNDVVELELAKAAADAANTQVASLKIELYKLKQHEHSCDSFHSKRVTHFSKLQRLDDLESQLAHITAQNDGLQQENHDLKASLFQIKQHYHSDDHLHQRRLGAYTQVQHLELLKPELEDTKKKLEVAHHQLYVLKQHLHHAQEENGVLMNRLKQAESTQYNSNTYYPQTPSTNNGALMTPKKSIRASKNGSARATPQNSDNSVVAAAAAAAAAAAVPEELHKLLKDLRSQHATAIHAVESKVYWDASYVALIVAVLSSLAYGVFFRF